jgi:hypothetical protein
MQNGEKKALPEPQSKAAPDTPDRPPNMPGSFGSPDNADAADNNRLNGDDGSIGQWARKLFKNSNTPAPTSNRGTDGPHISQDVQATKSNIANAIKDCRPTNRGAINTKLHQDPPTQLDNGGYCSGDQYENLHKASKITHASRIIEIWFGKSQTETPADLTVVLSQFLPVIFGLTAVFGVDPAAVNIFLDKTSNTVAFNSNGSLFFNLAWFMGVHAEKYGTVRGRQRAWDSWFLTYCHELAHNLVTDHNARHNWYNSQIAIEYSAKFRAKLQEVMAESRLVEDGTV